jgi:dipeptidyl aminopeptidase/acylaminoacyl peptidase
MSRPFALVASVVAAAIAVGPRANGLAAQGTDPFTLEQLLSFPFAANLVAAPSGASVAWTINSQGVRNVFAADGPAFAVRQLTRNRVDDGQELTNLAFTGDGRFLVYVRGGNHAANRPDPVEPPNPASQTVQPVMQVWSIARAGGDPLPLGEGDSPSPSPRGSPVAFLKSGRILIAAADGSEPAAAIPVTGVNAGLTWSPDGSKLAFESDQDGHMAIGVFSPADRTVRYVSGSSTSRDSSPVWSPEGRSIAFVREAVSDPARLASGARPWSIWVSGIGTLTARQVWQSGDGPVDSLPPALNRARLLWTRDNRIVFLSYHDGWQHLHAVAISGGPARLLTPGRFMVEDFVLAPDRRTVFYNANTGADRDDGERRHIFRVGAGAGRPEQLTWGRGVEWNPAVTADGKTLAYIESDAVQPPRAAIAPLDRGAARPLAAPAPGFPASRLASPEHVVIDTEGGTLLHGELFRPVQRGPRPAIVFLHGGPAQQMLLGWHYDEYYAHAYALNQYLVTRGFVVLSVNYRLGTGYGHQFQFPEHAGSEGSSELEDVIAAGHYLARRSDVDRERIGVWGLSYGGYLTALALGRASDVFSAGVDVHGIHDLIMSQIMAAAPDERGARPWRSPILLIHADDDRNVPFGQTVDFERALAAKGIPVESCVIPDDVHDFLLFRSWKAAGQATADFFDRTLLNRPSPSGR